MMNLLADVPGALPEELVQTLLETRAVRIERIVSTGQSSPPGFWYDQPKGEWVLILQGAASLQIEGDPQPLRMGPGDHVYLPPHRKHRIEWTDPHMPTIWLAVWIEES